MNDADLEHSMDAPAGHAGRARASQPDRVRVPRNTTSRRSKT